MTGYGDSFYGSDWYSGSPYIANTEQTIGICVRIVKPIGSVPPVMDTIYYGLAERFNYLQLGIQAFGLFNKITYAKGSTQVDNSIIPSLDDVWGQIYDLPRLTGESDDDYRMRLQTYVKVLVSCGTAPACQEVLDFLIGYPGSTRLTSLWPARVLIDFADVAAMRSARSRSSLLNSILPGMFAAGVDYELLLPYLDSSITATIQGDTETAGYILAAIATTNELGIGIGALIAFETYLDIAIRSSIQADRVLAGSMRAAVMIDQLIEPSVAAAIRGEPEQTISLYGAIAIQNDLPCGHRAAIMGEAESGSISIYAAIARDFERRAGLLARICYMYELASGIVASIRTKREQSIGIRVRIARSID